MHARNNSNGRNSSFVMLWDLGILSLSRRFTLVFEGLGDEPIEKMRIVLQYRLALFCELPS